MLTVEFNNASLAILAATIALALYLRLGFSTPISLVHPLLLAKQSEVSSTRLKDESGIYRNWGTGHGVPLPTKPSGAIGLVSDLVDTNPDGMDSVRGRQMYHGILDIFKGIIGEAEEPKAGDNVTIILAHIPTKSTPETATTDSSKSVIELAALHLCTSLSAQLQLLLLPSSSQLETALTSPHHALPKLFFCRLPLLQNLLDHLIPYTRSASKQDKPLFGIIVADVPLLSQSTSSPNTVLQTLGGKHSILVSSYWDILSSGSDRLATLHHEDKYGDLSPEEVRAREERAKEYAGMFQQDVVQRRQGKGRGEDGLLRGEGRKVPEDVHALVYGKDQQVYTVTNENITAGLASLFSLFPASHRPTPSLPSPASQGTFRSLLPGGKAAPAPVTQKKIEDVYLIDESMNTPVGISLMLLGVMTTQSEQHKTQLVNLDDTQSSDLASWLPLAMTGKRASQTPPTLAFIHKDRLEQIVRASSSLSRKSPFYDIARRNKLVDLQAGYLSRSGWLWSRFVWDGVWGNEGMGRVPKSLRGIIVLGEPPSASLVREAQILLSVPVARAFTSPLSAGPVLASHFHDFQHFDADKEARIHVGPPTINAEVMLKGGDVEAVEIGEDPKGTLMARGPGFARRAGEELDGNRWVDLGLTATVRTNGTFKV